MKQACVIVALIAAVAHAEDYDEGKRVAHLAAALEQLRAVDPVVLERELHEATRAKCGTAPASACRLTVANELCGKRACLAAADVMVTNQHAERALVDERTRMRLVTTSADYHTAVLAELRKSYAILAAELVLAKPESSLAAQIDRFCALRDQIARRCEPNAPACLGTIAYQRCAAGLVWFVSTEKKR